MQFEFSSLFHPFALGAILFICLVIFAAMSAAFLYHWKEYGTNARLIRFAPTVYLAISAALGALAIISYLALL